MDARWLKQPAKIGGLLDHLVFGIDRMRASNPSTAVGRLRRPLIVACMRKRAAQVFHMDGWFLSSVLGKLIAWFILGEDVVVAEVSSGV
jgi:hypothetical protein